MLGLHDEYFNLSNEVAKWRTTFEGGKKFIDTYLRKFSTKENENDFALRKSSAYCPNLCAAAINEYLNRFVSGLSKVSRHGNTTYLEQVVGKRGGVAGDGQSLDVFIANKILPELMPMGRVGIFVDNLPQVGETLADETSFPYFVLYTREQIKNWRYDRDGLTHLHLEYEHQTYDDIGFPKGTEVRDLYFVRTNEGIVFWETGKKEEKLREGILDLPMIPFVDLQLNRPLMRDIADHQIALLNIESSDVQYILEANFPFLAEQYQKTYDYQRLAVTTNKDLEAKNAADPAYEAKHGADSGPETPVGARRGIRYGMNLERPQFIHPSSEPLQASMKKQAQIEEQIRKILMLSIINLKGVSASQQSRQESNQTVDSGLYVLGKILETAENQLAQIWAAYTNSEPAVISYPSRYSIMSEEEISAVVKRFKDTLTLLPSRKYQGHIAEELINNLLPSLTFAELEEIVKELDEFTTLVADPDIVREDVEAGLLSKVLGAKIRGYPEGDVEVADQEHATRLARIQEAQTEGARGVTDMGDPSDGKREKEQSDPTKRGDENNRTAEDSDDGS